MKDNRRVIKLPNWFSVSAAQQNFETLLMRLAGKPDLQFLQLGAFSGDASVWLLDNVLTDKTSHLTDVDTWEGSDETQHEKLNFKDVEYVYDYKTKKYKNLTKVKSTTLLFLKQAPIEHYDFIYVDADHTSAGVLVDAELSFLSLKSGGVLAFDDYEWNDGKGEAFRPQGGIDLFLHRHQGKYKLIHKGWQIWIVKA